MRECGGCLRLVQERRAKLGVRRKGRWEDLDRHGPGEPDLAGQVHHSHTAATELAIERVLAGQRGLEGDEIGIGGGRHSLERWVARGGIHRLVDRPTGVEPNNGTRESDRP
jgi:hypothetical protein